jgi:hypothetical protein
MADHNELGKLGEELAGVSAEKRLCYFRNQLDFPKAEIDIIAKKEP